MIQNMGDTVELYNGVKMPGLGFGQTESAGCCRKNGIVVEAWSPLGTG